MIRLAKMFMTGALGGALLFLCDYDLLLYPSGAGHTIFTFFHGLLFPHRTPYWQQDLILMTSLGALAGLLVFLLVAAMAKLRPAGPLAVPRVRDTTVRRDLSHIQVRRATPGDATAIATLAHQLGYPCSAFQVGGRLQAIVALPDHSVLVAVLNGEVAGWIHVYMAQWLESDCFAEIGGIVVNDACRGRGVGGRLVLAAQEWATGRGLSLMRVRSRSDRSAAHAFYTNQGFARVKEQYVFDKTLDLT